MIVIKFRKDLFHDGFSEKDCLGSYTKPLTILPYGCHFAVIQIDDLPVATHKRLLLLLEIFRINA